MNSIWVEVPGYPDYMVSPEGNFLNRVRGRVLKKGNSRGYETITLYNNKIPLTIRAHKLVANVFCKKEAHHTEVNHINGIKNDNHYTNLEWCTSSENQRHSYDVLKNKSVRGSAHGIAKLTEKDVLEICKLIGKMDYPSIAKKFNISTATICNIKKGKVWQHLTKGILNES